MHQHMPSQLKSVVLTFWTTGKHLLGQFFAGETLQTPHQTQIRCYKSLILFAMVNCLSLDNFVDEWFYGSIHLRAEIAFQAEIPGLEFWPVFQAEISGLIFPGQNFRPKFFRPEFQAKIPGQNSKPKFWAEIPGRNSKPKLQAKLSSQNMPC